VAMEDNYKVGDVIEFIPTHSYGVIVKLRLWWRGPGVQVVWVPYRRNCSPFVLYEHIRKVGEIDKGDR